MSSMVHTNPVVKQWRMVHVWSGQEMVVDAVGPRDALFGIGGWGRLESRDGWAYSGDWKVCLTAVSALGMREVQNG